MTAKTSHVERSRTAHRTRPSITRGCMKQVDANDAGRKRFAKKGKALVLANDVWVTRVVRAIQSLYSVSFRKCPPGHALARELSSSEGTCLSISYNGFIRDAFLSSGSSDLFTVAIC